MQVTPPSRFRALSSNARTQEKVVRIIEDKLVDYKHQRNLKCLNNEDLRLRFCFEFDQEISNFDIDWITSFYERAGWDIFCIEQKVSGTYQVYLESKAVKN